MYIFTLVFFHRFPRLFPGVVDYLPLNFQTPPSDTSLGKFIIRFDVSLIFFIPYYSNFFFNFCPLPDPSYFSLDFLNSISLYPPLSIKLFHTQFSNFSLDFLFVSPPSLSSFSLPDPSNSIFELYIPIPTLSVKFFPYLTPVTLFLNSISLSPPLSVKFYTT